jgi:sugar phosphate permease
MRRRGPSLVAAEVEAQLAIDASERIAIPDERAARIERTPSVPVAALAVQGYGSPITGRRKWRSIVFASTWLAYAAFYLTRKNYAIAQPAFMSELHWSKSDVGTIVTGYLTAYAIGQFVSGILCDRMGARVLLALGFVATAAASITLGFANTIVVMAIVYTLNGFAQSTGWPSVTRAMRNWTTVEERGEVMGWWGTTYPIGDAASTAVATFVLGLWGWRSAFWAPAVVVVLVGIGVTMLLRDHPHDVGLSLDDANEAPPAPKRATFDLTGTLKALTQVRVITLGLAYFCIKFVRYTFTFWIGVYLVERMQFSVEEAGYLQVPFPLIGCAGSIVAGVISDRFFSARRGPVAVIMLVFLVLGLLAFLVLPKSSLLVSANLGLVGFMTFGPDMLVSAAAAMDFAKEDSAATVLGAINGMGSIGAALSGWLVGVVSETYGWNAIFVMMAAMAVACIAITLTLWNARAE